MNDCDDPRLQAIRYSLQKNRCPAANIQPTADVGVYALYICDPFPIENLGVNTSGLLYIGMTEDSQKARNHFCHNDSSSSSPRRSLGALLKSELRLTAIPRGSGNSPKDMTHFRFADDGEQRLTGWMIRHLEYSFVSLIDNIPDVERALIVCLMPSLNLDKWQNPHRAAIKQLRKVCADEARRAGPIMEHS